MRLTHSKMGRRERGVGDGVTVGVRVGVRVGVNVGVGVGVFVGVDVAVGVGAEPVVTPSVKQFASNLNMLLPVF